MKRFRFFFPFLIIIIVWFFFSSPYFLQGKTPFDSTYLVNFFSPWNSYKEFASPVKNNAMPDIIGQIYPWKKLVIDTWKTGQIPLWNPYVFSGNPLMANYQSAVFSPLNLIFFILPFIDAWSLLVLLQPLLAGFFMYLLARSLGRSKWASLIAAISFMFCGFITTWMGYATIGYSILFLPLAVYSIEKFFQKSSIWYLILFSLTIPLSFFSGHFQISLYFLLTILLYILLKFYETGISSCKKIIAVLFCLFIGLLLSSPQLLPSIEFYLQSFRSGIFQKLEIIPLGYIPTFIAPDFFGNPVTRNDWFGHYAEWNFYIGLIPLMLAIYSILNKKVTKTLYLFVFGLLALLLAFDTPIQALFLQLKIPVLSTSAASRIIVVYIFLFSLLSSFGFDFLLEDVRNKKNKKIITWLVSFLIVVLFLWIFSRFFLPVDKMVIARQNLIIPTLLFLLFFFSIIISFIVKSNKKFLFLSVIFVVLVSLDMLRFATKWQPFEPKQLVYPEIPITQEFKQISSYYRVFGNFGGEVSNYYHLPSVEGYDPLYIRRYGQFVASLDTGKINDSYRSVVSFPKRGGNEEQAVNLLAVKYFVHKISDGRSVWAYPVWNNLKKYKLAYRDDKYEVYENQEVFPKAFMVCDYTVETDSQKIISAMFKKGQDLKKRIILEKDPKIGKCLAPGEAKIATYSSNRIEIDTNSLDTNLLFLSDNYFPGWKAFVDGREVPIYRADFTFRAISVEKGSHKVIFVYSPKTFNIGLKLAGVGVLFLILLFLFPKLKLK